MKREHPLATHDQSWDDVGATWDDIAGDSDEESGDGIRWADEATVPAYLLGTGQGGGLKKNGFVIPEDGPMSEMPTYVRTLERHVEEDTETVMGHESPASGVVAAVGDPEPIDVPSVPAEGGSSGSSSEGSPIEKLGAALEAMKMNRGRNRVPTPLQGNVPEIDW